MLKNKSLLEEIATFLNYLQKNYEVPEKRNISKIQGIYGKDKYFQIINYCLEGKYVIQEDISPVLNKKEWVIKITIKGVQFLENFKKEKNQERISVSNVYLTAALFAITLLQGLISLVYYYLDLKNRGFIQDSFIFLFLSSIVMEGVFILLFKLNPK